MARRSQEAPYKQAADYAVHRQAISVQPRTAVTISKVLSRITENKILTFIALFCGLGLGIFW
jgi:hypothetical protein